MPLNKKKKKDVKKAMKHVSVFRLYYNEYVSVVSFSAAFLKYISSVHLRYYSKIFLFSFLERS